MHIFQIITSSAVIIIASTAVYFVVELPKLFRELKVEQKKATNSMELQREAYFRQIGGKDLSKLFKDWVDLLYDADRRLKNFNKNDVIKLISSTVVYGSTKTIHLYSSYMKNIYNSDIAEIQDKDGSYSAFKQLLYIAYIIASLKFDFTGYEVDPIKLLEIKITDLQDIKENEDFKKAHEDLKKEIKKY